MCARASATRGGLLRLRREMVVARGVMTIMRLHHNHRGECQVGSRSLWAKDLPSGELELKVQRYITLLSSTYANESRVTTDPCVTRDTKRDDLHEFFMLMTSMFGYIIS